MIRRNIELEARLIDDLLDLTRITRGKLNLVPRPVDVQTLIGHVVEICRPDAEAKRLRLAVDPSGPPAWVNADPARLHQVLWNLVKNAVKFTPEGGKVEVGAYVVAGGQSDERGTMNDEQKMGTAPGPCSSFIVPRFIVSPSRRPSPRHRHRHRPARPAAGVRRVRAGGAPTPTGSAASGWGWPSARRW